MTAQGLISFIIIVIIGIAAYFFFFGGGSDGAERLSIIYTKSEGWGPCSAYEGGCYREAMLFNDGRYIVTSGDGAVETFLSDDELENFKEAVRQEDVMDKSCKASQLLDYWATYTLTIDGDSRQITHPGCEDEMNYVDSFLPEV